MVIKKKDEDSDDEEVQCPRQCRPTPLAPFEAAICVRRGARIVLAALHFDDPQDGIWSQEARKKRQRAANQRRMRGGMKKAS